MYDADTRETLDVYQMRKNRTSVFMYWNITLTNREMRRASFSYDARDGHGLVLVETSSQLGVVISDSTNKTTIRRKWQLIMYTQLLLKLIYYTYIWRCVCVCNKTNSFSIYSSAILFCVDKFRMPSSLQHQGLAPLEMLAGMVFGVFSKIPMNGKTTKQAVTWKIYTRFI